MLIATNANAVQSMEQILVNVKALVRPITGLVLIISFLLGILMMLRGLLMMRQFALPINQASKPGEIAGPLVHLFVGAILIYIPAASDSLSLTLFDINIANTSIMDINTSASPKASQELLGYTETVIKDQWAALFDTIVVYIQLIGFIAFIRGWLLIGESGNPGVQPGSISRGVVHVIGGILAINFVPFIQALQETLMKT